MDAIDSLAAFSERLRKAHPLPAGWTQKWVEPPWAGRPPACRGCGRDPAAEILARKWDNVPIVRDDKKAQVQLVSCAMLCEKCGTNKEAMERVIMQIFMPLAPENLGGPLNPGGVAPPRPGGGS